MDITRFYELRKRLYAAAASGCGAVNEDFRLKRAIEAFEPLAQANKAFLKLYSDCVKLFTSDDPADVLSDCIALADALAVTQGSFSDSSETKPSEINTEMKILPVTYSAISELCEKIEKCSPKLSELSAEETTLISDGRVLSAFVKSADKGNVYLKDFAENVISLWGETVVQMLKNAVDLTDEKASGTRIDYIYMAVGAKENDFYISLAKNPEAPQNIRISAIKAMSHDPANSEILLELYNTEKGKVKNTALMAVLELNPPEADEILAKLIEKTKDKYDKYADYVRISPSRTAEEFVRAQITETSQAIRSRNTSQAVVPIENTADLFRNKAGIADCFIEADELSRLWGGGENYVSSIVLKLNDVLIKDLRNKDNEKYRSLITELFEKRSDDFLPAYFFMKFIESPESAVEMLSEKLKRQHLFVSLFLSNIRYSPAHRSYYTEYVYQYVYTNNNESPGKLFLFESFPDSLLKFMCTPSAYNKASSDGVCKAFRMFAKSCSNEDRERINSAMFEFALERGNNYPSFSGLELMEQCCPPEMGYRCKGMMTNYVLDSLHTNHRAVYCNIMERLPMSSGEKIEELTELIDKTARVMGLFTKEIKDAQISYIKREIDIIMKDQL
ncbi:MAG: hypothetical protein ACI4JK_03555 [Oscillospiraceae bacterium]